MAPGRAFAPRAAETEAPPAEPDAPPVAPAAAGAVLRAPSPYEDLPVPSYGAAVVSLPLGAHGRRPVIVAAHGHRDRPDWQCQVARRFVGDRAFVLCPRGRACAPMAVGEEPRFTFWDVVQFTKEVEAGLAALRRAYPDFVDLDKPILYGHSTGAYVGADMARRDPARWSRVILAEGGFGGWTLPVAKVFLKGGGARVLFVCGTEACATPSTLAVHALDEAGLPARLGYAVGAGHAGDGPIVEEAVKAFDWVVEGDPRFARDP